MLKVPESQPLYSLPREIEGTILEDGSNLNLGLWVAFPVLVKPRYLTNLTQAEEKPMLCWKCELPMTPHFAAVWTNWGEYKPADSVTWVCGNCGATSHES